MVKPNGQFFYTNPLAATATPLPPSLTKCGSWNATESKSLLKQEWIVSGTIHGVLNAANFAELNVLRSFARCLLIVKS